MGVSMMGFEFTAEMVGWGVTGIIGLFAIFGMFWGLIRGLQKTAFRGLWLVLVALILLLLTPIITKWLLSIDLSRFGWQIDGQLITSLDGVIESFLLKIEGVGEATQNNPILTEFIKKAPLLLLNSVVFVLLFWIFKILLWPVWAIFAKVFFKKYKTIDGVKGKKMPKEEREKVKRFRGLGMLIGIICGLFVGALTIMPVMGVLDVVTKLNGANVSFITGEKSEEGIIDYYVGEYSDMLYAAKDNVGTKALKYTGMSWINEKMFDQLSTIKVGKESISLNDEVDGVVMVLNAVGEIRCTDFNNLTQESVASVITNARKIVNYIFELKTFTVLGDELVPYLADFVSQEDFILTGVEQGDSIIQEALSELAATNMGYLKNEFIAIIDVAEAINNADMVVPLLYKNIPFEEYLDRCTPTVVDEIIEALFTSRIFTAISVSIINEGLELALEQLDITEFEDNVSLTVNVIKEQFKNILNNVVELAQYMDIDGDNISVEKEALGPIGGILDSLKVLMTNNSFSDIIDKAKDTLAESFASGDFYEDSILDAIENFKNITNYKAEMEIYEDVWDDIITLMDSDLSDFGTIDTSLVGRVLDGLKDSLVFGPVIDDMIVNLLTQVKDGITADMTSDPDMATAIEDAFSAIIWNVEDDTLSRGNTFWTDELGTLGSLFGMNMSDIGSGTGTSVREVGEILDDIRGSILLTRNVNELTNPLHGKNAFEILISVMFDKATETLEGDGALLTEIMVEIKENLLGLPSNITYTSEFSYLADFLDKMDDFDATSLTPGSQGFKNTIKDFGVMLDDLDESRLFVNESNESCPDIRQKFVTYMLDELQSSMNVGFTQTLLEDMKENVIYIESYEAEFGYLASLTSLVDTFNGSSSSSGFDTAMANLGTTLDNLGGSKLFVHEADSTDPTDTTKDLRRDILTYLIGQIKDNLNSALGSGINASALVGGTNSLTAEMLNNVDNMPLPSETATGKTPYADEMHHLLKLVDALAGIADYGNLLNSSGTLFNLGKDLDELKQGYNEGTKEYNASVLCENAGYYVVRMFVDAVSGLNNLTVAVSDDNVRDQIIAAFVANAEKVNSTNYYAAGISYDETVAEGLNYTQALVSFMQITNLVTELTLFTGSGSSLAVETVDQIADILNNLQNQVMADYNVAKIIGGYVLAQFKDSISPELPHYSTWTAAIERERSYIDNVTSDYLFSSIGNGYRVSLAIAVIDFANTMAVGEPQRESVITDYLNLTYTITFDVGAGVEYYGMLPTMVRKQSGAIINLPSCTIIREGYTFAGWKREGDSTVYSAGTSFNMPNENVAFIAQWNEI